MNNFLLFIVAFLAAILIGTALLVPMADARSERGPREWTDRQTFKGEAKFEDEIYKDPIIINDIGQFRVWSMGLDNLDNNPGTSSVTCFSGTSLYYQLKPDRVHIIDTYAIQVSVNDWLGFDVGGVTTITAFAGVTLVMFDAAAHPYSKAEVIFGVTGSTGYDRMKTGVTPVKVWPNPNTDNLSLVTNYTLGNYGWQRQKMIVMSSVSPFGANASTGIPYDATNAYSPGAILKRPGDRVVIQAMGPGSSVSAFCTEFKTNAPSLGAN